MYYIFFQKEGENVPQILDDSHYKEIALSKMKDFAKDFIIQEEGIRKLETVYKKSKEEVSTESNGFYFVEDGDVIFIYRKYPVTKLIRGYFLDSQEVENRVELHSRFGITERKLKQKVKEGTVFNQEILNQKLFEVGFKPQPTTFLIKKK